MANVLKMAKKYAIIGLLENGWSHRRIARELSVDRDTVARYDRLRKTNPAISTPGSGFIDHSNAAISTPGSDLKENSKPAISTPGSSHASPGRASLCEPFSSVIEKKLEQGLSAQRIFQDLFADHGFDGSYSSIKRFVRRIKASTPLPFRRMEVEPGQEAQVDFGSGAWIEEDGKRRKPHVLRVVLSHSRKGYSEPLHRQTTENFIRTIENSFRHFGGVPKTLVIDNLKAAVTRADWFDPDLNPRILEFARHYNIVILPTKPRMPRHKGKIESSVKYVKSNALKGRVFSSLAEQREFLAHWEKTIADTRIHGTTKKQVRRVFEDVEKPALQPLPEDPFPFYHEGRRRVHRDGHVEIEGAYYSVPPEYLGRDVWVRWDTRLVRITNDRFEQIAFHSKADSGRFSTNRAHIPERKIPGVERGLEYLLDKTRCIGPCSHQWAREMIENRGLEGVRVLQGFVTLTRKYDSWQIENASRTALKANLFRLRPIRELLKRSEGEPAPEFAQSHEIIRPLSQYQELLTAISRTTSKEEIP